MKTEEKKILSACFEGNLEVVKSLLLRDPKLASMTDVEGEDWEQGSSTLTLACCKGSLEIIKLLLASGAEINAVSKEGTALSFASFAGHAEVVKHLLESGADPNSTSSSGESPLHAAAIMGYTEILIRGHPSAVSLPAPGCCLWTCGDSRGSFSQGGSQGFRRPHRPKVNSLGGSI